MSRMMGHCFLIPSLTAQFISQEHQDTVNGLKEERIW